MDAVLVTNSTVSFLSISFPKSLEQHVKAINCSIQGVMLNTAANEFFRPERQVNLKF